MSTPAASPNTTTPSPDTSSSDPVPPDAHCSPDLVPPKTDFSPDVDSPNAPTPSDPPSPTTAPSEAPSLAAASPIEPAEPGLPSPDTPSPVVLPSGASLLVATSLNTIPATDAASALEPDSPSDSDRQARLALNHAVEPADPLIGRLLARHTPSQILAAIHADQLADLDPDPSRRDRLIDRCVGLKLRLEPGQVESGIAAADAVGARFIVPTDDDWPRQLNDLGELRPIGIWATGHWPPIPPNTPAETGNMPAFMSVVGARACTGYGAYIAGVIGADLASARVAVVSGAALGIDAAAHRGALAVGGPTVAVLACGIDRVYPRIHEGLLRAIAGRGAVLSELPPGASPTRFRFLHRNRIIAALGAGTVVVEAARRSGSLVTARLAAELGRAVMAVPGPVTSDQSAGTHELIRDGATLVTSAAHAREACASLTDASLIAREAARSEEIL